MSLLDSVLALATPVYAWTGGNAWQDVAGTVAAAPGDPVRNLPDARGTGFELTGASGTAVLETVGDNLCLRTTAGGAGLAAAFTYALPVTIAMVVDLQNAVSSSSDVMLDGNTIITLGFGGSDSPNALNGASAEGSFTAGGTNRQHTAELVRKWAAVVVEVSTTHVKIWQNGRIVLANASAQSTALGGLTLGGLGGANGRGSDARFGLLAAYSGALISSNLASVATLGADLIQSFGITPRSASTETVVVCIGDSITAGFGFSRNSAWPEQLVALKGGQWTARNTGWPGRSALQLAGDLPILAGQYSAFSTRAVVLAGTNDILLGANGATTSTRVKALWADLIGRGYDVYAATIPALADWTGGAPGGAEAARVAANAEIVSTWASLGCAGLIDLAADARLSDGNNATYFQSDKLHLTIAGSGVIAELANLAIEFVSTEVVENFNYPKISATAARLITKFGQAWTLTTTTGPAVSTSRTYPGVQIDTVTGLSGDGGNGAYFGDSGVQIGDVVLLLHPSANPVQGDRIQDAAGNSYVLIVKPNPVKPAGTVLMWQVWGRAG